MSLFVAGAAVAEQMSGTLERETLRVSTQTASPGGKSKDGLSFAISCSDMFGSCSNRPLARNGASYLASQIVQ